MEIFIEIILKAGRSAVELALFVLLPVMVVMLSLMRLLEARGVLDWVVVRLTPFLKPFGLTGLGVFAALQINFVSFAAPLATLTMMEQRGASDRHIAATLAMVFAMSQANAALPMMTMGLNIGVTLLFSLTGGLIAAAATYYLFGKGLSSAEAQLDETLHHPVADNAKGILDVINRAGAEAFKIAVGAIPMLVLSLVVVTIGGIVEIAPLFWIDSTVEKVEGVRPYTPLELAGRNIYMREGCYNCHSQMIRPFRDEVERYGHFSLAAESMYDHPFQWGSKRTGPDLARVGGRYSDEWHVQHMKDPRAVVPESIMPPYAFLAENDLKAHDMGRDLRALSRVGVPYSEAAIAAADADLAAQADPEADTAALLARYPKAQVRDFDGDPKRLTEMDALVAYLQMLGTLVDFDAAAAQEKPR